MDEVYTQKPQEFTNTAAAPVSIGDWFLTMLITAIPIVGLVMLFVWSFGSGTNPNKQNWAKAMLIWMLISMVLGIVFFGALMALILGTSGHSY